MCFLALLYIRQRIFTYSVNTVEVCMVFFRRSRTFGILDKPGGTLNGACAYILSHLKDTHATVLNVHWFVLFDEFLKSHGMSEICLRRRPTAWKFVVVR